MTGPFIDAIGQTHTPTPGPVRIVSLVPSLTELLFALGLGDSVVGCTPFCVHPAEGVHTVVQVGGTKNPKLDKIASLSPTHLVVNIDENRREDVEALRAFVPNIIVTHPQAPLDNLELFWLLGGIFACQDQADKLRARFEAALTRLREGYPQYVPRRVLYLIWRRPWMSIGEDTYIARTLSLVRWHTVTHHPQERYPTVELDSVVFRRTDLILLSSEPYPFKEKHAAEIRSLAGPNPPPIRFVDGEMVSWYGSRAVEGLDYLRRFALT